MYTSTEICEALGDKKKFRLFLGIPDRHSQNKFKMCCQSYECHFQADWRGK